MKKVINFLSFTLLIFLFSNITALALEECKYYDKDNNELVLEVGGSKGNYYFKDTTYGFSIKTNLKNGVCPTSVIKLSNGSQSKTSLKGRVTPRRDTHDVAS